jgi:hypothetical protein
MATSMKLDISRLKNLVERSGKITAQCPACASAGGDRKGEHLVLFPTGAYGCVVHQGDKDHLRLIAQLLGWSGTTSRVPSPITIKTHPHHRRKPPHA